MFNKKMSIFAIAIGIAILTIGTIAVKGFILDMKPEEMQNFSQKPVENSNIQNTNDNKTDVQVMKVNAEVEKNDVKDEKSENGDLKQKLDKIKEDLAAQGIVVKDAKENGLYNPREVVQFGTNANVVIEGIRTGADRRVILNNKYYLIIDISLGNLTDNDYFSDYSDFTLEDSLGYTYDPTITFSGRGNIVGTVSAKNLRRGEIAFEVPSNEKGFILKYNSSKFSDIKMVNFKIDTSSLAKY